MRACVRVYVCLQIHRMGEVLVRLHARDACAVIDACVRARASDALLRREREYGTRQRERERAKTVSLAR